MKNIMPRAFAGLTTAAKKGAEGVHFFGANVGLLHITEATLRGAIAAAQDANVLYQATIAAHPRAVAVLSATDKQVGQFIASARDVLKMRLGSQYSMKWAEVGFRTPTLRVPRRREVRLNRLKSLELYFLAHPDAEVEVLGLTAQASNALHRTMLDQMTAVDAARVAQRQQKAAKNAAVEELRLAMQRLYRELKVLLPRNDSRWMEFGFNVSADLAVPSAPEAVHVEPIGGGKVAVAYERPVGATRFRIFEKVEGRDVDFVHADTVHELKAFIGGFEPGARAQFYIIAANAAGESPPSAVVECLVV